MKRIILGLFFIGLLTKLNAGFFSSGFITYQHISGNKFKIIFQITHDCRAIDPGSTMNLNVRDNINTNNSANLTMNRTSIKEISWNKIGSCSSKSFGVQLLTYEYIMNLDSLLGGALKSVCKIYMSGQMCCRNSAISTYGPGNGYVTCMMDRCYSQNNSGPSVQNLHMNYFYVNNTKYFNPIATDTIDNDFLEFEMVAPLNDFNSNETFNSPYSARYPLSPFCLQSGQLNCTELPLSTPPRGLYFDSLNGNLIFTSTNSLEVGSIVYKAKEYRYINGVKRLIGYYYIDNYFVGTQSGYTNPVITKNSLKLQHQFIAGKTGTIFLATQHNDTNKVDSVILTCFNPIKGSSVSISKKWRPDLTFTWTPECEDIRKEPYIFYINFINENVFSINPQQIAINIFVNSDLNLGNDTVICKNSTYNLQSNITGKYKWNNSMTDTFKSYTATNAGTYYLEVDRNGCIVKDSIKLKEINQKPDVYLGNDTVICNQVPNAQITVAAPFDPFVRYKWNRDSTQKYSFIYFRDTGWVSVTGTNVCGSSTDSVYVQRNSSPQVNLPSDTLICNSSSWQIHATGKGSGALLWDNLLTDSLRTVDSSGLYSISINNNCGQDSDSIYVEFLNAPSFYLPNDTIVCNGRYPRFDLSSINASIIWSDARTDKVYHAFKAGLLWAQATNNCGVYRDSVLIVNQSTPFIKPYKDTFLCEPFVLILKPFCNSCDYKWNNQINSQSISIQSPGTYTLWAGNYCGNVNDTFVVDSDSFPAFKLPADTTLKPVYLKIQADYVRGKLKWNTGDSSNSIIVNAPGTYWLTQSNLCGELTDTIHVMEKTNIHTTELTKLLFYPNPVKDVLLIQSEKTIENLFLMNSSGQLIPLNIQCGTTSCEVDLHHLSAGIYIIRVQIQGQMYYKYIQKI